MQERLLIIQCPGKNSLRQASLIFAGAYSDLEKTRYRFSSEGRIYCKAPDSKTRLPSGSLIKAKRIPKFVLYGAR